MSRCCTLVSWRIGEGGGGVEVSQSVSQLVVMVMVGGAASSVEGGVRRVIRPALYRIWSIVVDPNY